MASPSATNVEFAVWGNVFQVQQSMATQKNRLTWFLLASRRNPTWLLEAAHLDREDADRLHVSWTFQHSQKSFIHKAPSSQVGMEIARPSCRTFGTRYCITTSLIGGYSVVAADNVVEVLHNNLSPT